MSDERDIEGWRKGQMIDERQNPMRQDGSTDEGDLDGVEMGREMCLTRDHHFSDEGLSKRRNSW